MVKHNRQGRSRCTLQQNLAKAGQLLCVDSGSYSDYKVLGFFLVLRDFDPVGELQSYLDANPKQSKEYCFKKDSFFATLLAKGLLMEVQYGTLYLTGYCSSNEFRFKPAKSGSRFA
jgi:hypothetical protein